MVSLRELIVEVNPWWRGELRLDYHERELYDTVQKFRSQPQIIALVGLRRVGKTTLLLRLVRDAIDGGIDPRRILYFSFDERDARIRDVLREYESLFGRSSGDVDLVLLDEIQKLERWEDELKSLYDLHKDRVRFVVSGSESLFIRSGSRETLGGRLFEFEVRPLSFREYLGFKGQAFEPADLYERELSRLFDEFVITQGLPELVGVVDRDVITKYVRESIVERVVFRDLPELLNVREVSVLHAVLNILMEEPGQIITLSDLAGDLGVTRQTLSNYLTYLEEAFLVRKLYNYARNRRKTERKLKRYYPTLVSPGLTFRTDDLSRSRAFEWAVITQLRPEFFWRDPYGKEVDAVLVDDGAVPVEVKSGRIRTHGVTRFMEHFGVERGYVISRDVEETLKVDAGTVFVVPAYKALLLGPTMTGEQ